MIERVLQDIRFALRAFAKAPVFTIAVVGTIALAIGATSSIFAVADTILRRPLPFPGSDRTVRLCETNASVGDWCGASPANVADWLRTAPSLEAAGVARREGAVARVNGERFGVAGAIVSPGFFKVLALRPALGRLLEEGDLPPGANQVVVLSHTFWQRRLGGDAAIVGRSIVLGGQPIRVVGVLRADAYVPGDEFAEVEIWRPLTASIDDVEDRGWRGFTSIGRRRAGVSMTALYAELSGVRAQLARAYPEANKDWGLRIVDLRDSLVGTARPMLLVFLAAVGLVLVIACANVAGLLLVRASARTGEFAVRASLGAAGWRLAQQLVTESLLLAFAGAAVGILLAAWTTSAFVALAPATIPRLHEVTVDARVVLFSFTVAAAAALVFGLAPARSATRTDLNRVLKGARASGSADGRLRSVFVIAQLSLALMLLVGAGLLARTFVRFVDWRPGFDRSNLVTTWLSPSEARTRDAVAVMELVRDEVSGAPGIRSAALCSAGPLFGGEETGGLAIEGRPAFSPRDMPTVQFFDVSPGYFDTLGVRIVRGRDFAAADAAEAPNVGVVNETLARRFFPGENPIGKRVTVNDHAAEIVGVVADVKPLRPDRSATPQIYWPIRQYPRLGANLLLRTAPDVPGVEKAVRLRAGRVHAGIQLSTFITLDERVSRSLVSPRFNMLLVAGFALLAAALAAVGIYGLMASSIASRTRELGVRMALGATPRMLVNHALRRGLVLTAVGLTLGGIGSLAVARVLGSLLYGLPAHDLLALPAAVVVLAVTAGLACWLPARRTARIDPVSALRAE